MGDLAGTLVRAIADYCLGAKVAARSAPQGPWGMWGVGPADQLLSVEKVPT